MLRFLTSIFATALVVALLPATAGAVTPDPNGFRFSSSAYSVHENAGQAVITITRTDTSGEGHAYYIGVGLFHPCGASTCTATPPGNGDVPADFGPTQGELDFPPGVASESFTVPIVDHHFATTDKTLQLSIFNSWPQGVADPSKAVLTIINDDPGPPRDAQNPLDLPVAPTNGNPLSGARFFVDPDAGVAQAAKQHPGLHVIADQPGTSRWGAFNGDEVGLWISRYLVRASVQQPGSVPMMSTYRIVDNRCGGWTPSPSDVASYHGFITKVATAIGSFRAVMLLEVDSLITSGCLTPQGRAIRWRELNDAINVLEAQCPHVVIYLDAGAADAYTADKTAAMLRAAGVSKIQGFFVNPTHFDWTSREIAYGEAISRMTGGKHFIVNTGENGRGPLAPPDPARQGNEVLCSPAGRGLGPKPTTSTGYANVDAFAWTSNPGESDGTCGGRWPSAPPPASYWPWYGLMLIQNAVFHVDNHHWNSMGAPVGSASASRAKHKHKHRAPRRHRARKHHTARH